MAALILTTIGSLLLGAAAWFALGSRFTFDDDDRRNDLLNFVAFVCASVPVVFVLVFFGLG